MTKLYHFLGDDGGAVTIDWVALTAATLLLGMVIVYAIFGRGVEPVIDSINSELVGAAATVGTIEANRPNI